MSFLTLFARKFALIIVVGVTFLAFVGGPFFVLAYFGIKPLPYGFPSLVLFWCVVGAFAFALHEYQTNRRVEAINAAYREATHDQD